MRLSFLPLVPETLSLAAFVAASLIFVPILAISTTFSVVYVSILLRSGLNLLLHLFAEEPPVLVPSRTSYLQLVDGEAVEALGEPRLRSSRRSPHREGGRLGVLLRILGGYLGTLLRSSASLAAISVLFCVSSAAGSLLFWALLAAVSVAFCVCSAAFSAFCVSLATFSACCVSAAFSAFFWASSLTAISVFSGRPWQPSR